MTTYILSYLKREAPKASEKEIRSFIQSRSNPVTKARAYAIACSLRSTAFLVSKARWSRTLFIAPSWTVNHDISNAYMLVSRSDNLLGIVFLFSITSSIIISFRLKQGIKISLILFWEDWRKRHQTVYYKIFRFITYLRWDRWLLETSDKAWKIFRSIKGDELTAQKFLDWKYKIHIKDRMF